MAQYGQGQPGAHFGLLAGELVLGVEEVLLDVVERGVELHVEPCVIQGTVLDLPVPPGVVEHALPKRGERFGAWRSQRVQRAVAAASLEEAEQRTAGRYV